MVESYQHMLLTLFSANQWIFVKVLDLLLNTWLWLPSFFIYIGTNTNTFRNIFWQISKSQKSKVLDTTRSIFWKPKTSKVGNFYIFNLWTSKCLKLENLQICQYENETLLWNFESLKLWDFETSKRWNFELNNPLIRRLVLLDSSWLMA